MILISCPKCRNRIKLSEALLAPLMEKQTREWERKAQRLESRNRQLEATIEARVRRSLASMRAQVKSEAEASFGLALREKNLQLAGVRRQIEELKRRAERGSQQIQGEAQELELEELLKLKFTSDEIEPVPKGYVGADILHRVRDSRGQAAGIILWESKRTRNWSDGWLAKLRTDQRRAKAEIAVIVSHALPSALTSFELIDGIWVSEPRCALPLALALRQSLLAVARLGHSPASKATAAERLHRYVSSADFRRRVEAVVEQFAALREDLDRERRAATKFWARRETQIQIAIEAITGFCGDLEAVGATSLGEIEGLSVALLEPPTE